jgi:hypothetical protein
MSTQQRWPEKGRISVKWAIEDSSRPSGKRLTILRASVQSIHDLEVQIENSADEPIGVEFE